MTARPDAQNLPAMTSQNIVERVARALYEHWVGEQIDAEYAPWEKLGDKTSWRERAQAAIEAAGIEALTKRVGVLEEALQTAWKRLNTLAGVRFAAEKFDPYDLPAVETLRKWAKDAGAALNTVREEEK